MKIETLINEQDYFNDIEALKFFLKEYNINSIDDVLTFDTSEIDNEDLWNDFNRLQILCQDYLSSKK